MVEELESQFHKLPLEDAEVFYLANFLDNDKADALLHLLIEELRWQQDSIQMFGRSVAIPRLQAWYGDRGCHYTYSGLTMPPHPWIPALSDIKQAVEHACGITFNAVLANLYRNGQDSMGWHCDNEPELGEHPVLASVTLGTARRFCFRKKKDKTTKFEINLQHGSLLLMAGNTQQHWLHALPKRKGLEEPRINLTFRQVHHK